jgi:hypothetical protein
LGWLEPRRSRSVSAEALNVAPALLGLPLASPLRRALALGIDGLVLALLSNFTSWALAVAMVALAVLVRRSLGQEGARPWLASTIAAALVLAALAVAWSAARPTAPDAWDGAAREAVERAEAALGAASAASAPAADRAAELQRLIDDLEQLRARHEPPTLGDRLDRVVNEVGLGFGWGIVYFSLLPAFWQGRTVGKALLRLRVLELTGRPITPLRGLKRYGGYAAGLATGGLGFVQVLWDPNRQALHDKAAHTVVVDERAGAAGPAASSPH